MERVFSFLDFFSRSALGVFASLSLSLAPAMTRRRRLSTSPPLLLFAAALLLLSMSEIARPTEAQPLVREKEIESLISSLARDELFASLVRGSLSSLISKQKTPLFFHSQPTTGPSPYLIAPAPPTGTLSGGDLSSSQPYWRDPNQVGLPPLPGSGDDGGRGPRQGASPPVNGNNNGTDPSSSPPSSSPSNNTAPAPNNSTLTRGAQLVLPAAASLSVDPFSAMALGVASALLPPVLAAKAAELASAAAAKVFAKKASKKKKASKFCPLSPADRDLLRVATSAALSAGASALAESATVLELGRCALTLKATKPAAFQWVLLSGGQVNPCSIVLGKREGEEREERRREKKVQKSNKKTTQKT